MTNLDEAEYMAGRLEDVEASILWHNEVDIEVDIEASEIPLCGTSFAKLRSARSYGRRTAQ